jgi:hypothetical protein
MTNINADAASARENARASDGTFGSQAHSTPEVAIAPAPAGEPSAREVRGPVEEAFLAGIAKGVYDNDLAGSAVRAAGQRLYPNAQALVFEMNYTDEGEFLCFDTVTGPADSPANYQGYQPEDAERDQIDELVIPMSGAGCTGQEITGMRHLDGDTFLFEL